MSRKWSIALGISAVLVLGLGIAAWAGPGKQRQAGGQTGLRGRLLYGQLTQVSESGWTIKPELPPGLQQRLEAKAAARGIELPALPESVSVALSDSSKFWLDGQSAAAGDFKSGDEVVVRLDKSWKETGASIMGAADPQTARQYIMAKMDKQRGGHGGHGKRGKGQGEGGGPGGGRGPRVAFGEVIAISADSITIKPELPDFIKAQLEERQQRREQRQKERGAEGGGPAGAKGPGGPAGPRELPAELTFKLSDATVFVVNENEQDGNPFRVGDKVGILPARPEGAPGKGGRGRHGRGHGAADDDPEDPGMQGPPPGEQGGRGPRELLAGIVSDYASAEARMKEMHEQMKQQRQNKGGRNKGGKGRRGDDEGGPGPDDGD